MRLEYALCCSKAEPMKPRSIQTNALSNSTPSPEKYVRKLRVGAWNAAFIILGLLLIALVGEIYLRLANPFIRGTIPDRFVDGVGLIREPNAELRYANWDDDNFVVSYTNSLGFLDREPVSPERAAEGCHIAFIGDSFVEARAVPIVDKFHAQLEEMAALELPHLAITTQAYGIRKTGQINQLPFYDEYARRLNPKLVMLVFFRNDFADNSPGLHALFYGVDPDRMPYMSAQRDARGELQLRPPDPEYERFRLPRPQNPRYLRAWHRLIRVSYFAKWLDTKKFWVFDGIEAMRAISGIGNGRDVRADPIKAAWADMIAARPCCSSALADSLDTQFTEEHLPPIHEEALEYTAFGIEQFKRRTDRDGAALAILLATREMGTRGDPQFDRISAIAEARGIPVISDYDYVVRRGHDAENGRWRFDRHWNATGHQWAAEAVLEWLKANQGVCD